MKIAFDFPEEFGVRRAGESVPVDVKKIAPAMLANVFANGLTQKIGDAAAGLGPKSVAVGDAKPGDARAAMLETIGQLYDGIWARRTRGTAGNPINRFVWQVMATLAIAQGTVFGPTKKPATKADLLNKQGNVRADDEVVTGWLDGLFDKLDDKAQAGIMEKAQDLLDNHTAELERKARDRENTKRLQEEAAADLGGIKIG